MKQRLHPSDQHSFPCHTISCRNQAAPAPRPCERREHEQRARPTSLTPP
jgi:hypothetical protein